MGNRKGAPKILLSPAFSHNQNVVDARTKLADTQYARKWRLAANRSQGFMGDAHDQRFSGPNVFNLVRDPRVQYRMPRDVVLAFPLADLYHAAFG
ncbi:MAG: hypothetical protein ACLP5H_17745 [Desulfomonilaceae bacterium]